jgi:hypothetical protein
MLNQLPAEGPQVLRSVRGLWLERICLNVAGNHVWAESPLESSPYEPGVLLERMRRVSRLLERPDLGWLRWPSLQSILDRPAFVYAPAPPATPVFEMIEGYGGGLGAIPFGSIARQLAQLHDTSLAGAGIEASSLDYPVIDPLASFASGEPRDDDLELMRRALSECEHLREWIGATARLREIDRPRALLHGRWSTGTLFCPAGPGQPILALGGLDHWLGPPEFDLAYLCGELVELAAESMMRGVREGVALALRSIDTLCREYCRCRPVDGEILIALTARRIVSHLAANFAWRRRDGHALPAVRGLVAILRITETVLLQAGLSRSEGGDA